MITVGCEYLCIATLNLQVGSQLGMGKKMEATTGALRLPCASDALSVQPEDRTMARRSRQQLGRELENL